MNGEHAVPRHSTIIAGLTNRTRIVALRVFIAAATGLACAVGASGQTFPDRPLRLLVGLPVGGGADAVARVFAEGLSHGLGQQVLVENRLGSAGLIAADAAAKSMPNGYTLFFGGVSSHAIFASLYKKLPYDPVKDFAPISMIASYPLVLVVSASLPCQSLAEFIAYAKARPGQLNYASAGSGSPLHLSMEMLKTSAAIDLVHVPYKGGVQAMGDLLGGEVHAIFDALPTQLANIKGGRVRALAVTSKTRISQLPDVLTFSESGVADMEFSGWFAAFAPAGVPAETLRKLHAEVAKVLDDPSTRRRLDQLGAEAMGSTPLQLAEFQQAEIAKWAKAVKASGATAD
jgi:tripartite-type tricarboxylate transporter receptor subunit TctC